MRVFRLTRNKYAKELNGKGASKSGNRWNSKGTEMIYSAESRALAMAEVIVHLPLHTLPNDYVMVELNVPSNIPVKELRLKDLPDNWSDNPPAHQTQKIGDDFINANNFCILKVPSAVVPEDYNYLINPYHKQFENISIIAIKGFFFDPRLSRSHL